MTNDTRPSPSPVSSSPARKLTWPIFHESAQYTLDPYWQQVFEDCAKSRFPRGSGIDNTGKMVYIKSGKTCQWYKLTNDPEKTFVDLKQHFQEKLGLKSSQDREEIRAELNVLRKKLEESYGRTWKEIRKKNIRETIVRNYILDLKEKYKLDEEQTMQLSQLIKLGFLYNWIDNCNVVYQDKRIVDIKNLHYKKGRFELEEPKVLPKREYIPKIIKMSSLWKKNLEIPRNRYLL